jgi:hypothetical protein
MKNINNIHLLKELSPTWKPTDIAFLKSLEFFASDTIDITAAFLSQTRNNVEVWPDLSRQFYEITIRFEKVSGLRLDFPGSKMHQLSGFDIVDITDNRWEDKNFHIEDYEKGSIEFYCGNINIISAVTVEALA